MRGACDMAARRLMAKRLYTCVDCDNESAWALYQGYGFDIHDDAQCNVPGGLIGGIARGTQEPGNTGIGSVPLSAADKNMWSVSQINSVSTWQALTAARLVAAGGRLMLVTQLTW